VAILTFGPEFTNSIEVSYQKTFPKITACWSQPTTKGTTDLITRYTATRNESDKKMIQVFINTYINANSSFVGGLEFTA
jgi:hypothetical protein